ncbi:MAG TPA: SHOCT domain-containing protein [Flavobacterium sp.]|jgi:hypothetical protein|nr:SHOCT domain-containing protein [Flavobacterium sp.]
MMRKFFGILFLLIGISLFGIGVALVTAAEVSCRSIDAPILANTFYDIPAGDLSLMGNIFIVGGLSAFIIGIMLSVSKPKRQLEKEFELELLQKSQLVSVPDEHDVVTKIEKLGRLRALGFLNEDEFQAQKSRMLGV